MTSPRQASIIAAYGTQQRVSRALQERYSVIQVTRPSLTEEVAGLHQDEAVRIEVLVTPGGNRVPSEALSRLRNLRLIACTSSGYDGVDVSYSLTHRIAVTNCPKVNASSVADLAIGLLIASTRQLFVASQTLRAHGFVKPWPVAPGLTGRCAGVYGLGAIGLRVAQRLCALEMNVGYCARTAQPNVPYRFFPSVVTLAEWCDALIICVPATDETERSVNASVLAALGPSGFLVNVSRASVVDTATLCDFLERQAIAGAALDVCDAEYLQRLLSLPNATMTPHIGGSTEQAEEATCELVLRNVEAHFAAVPLLTPVFGPLSDANPQGAR